MTTRISGVELIKESISGLVYGVEWNQNVDKWRRIDEYGNSLTVSSSDFNRHPVWGGMRRCTLAADGTVNHYGSNPRGDGLTLTGADGRVMVEIPKFYVKSRSPATNIYRYWISPVPKVGYELHPAFLQRGGIERDYIYVGAYEADFDYDGADAAYAAANEKLHSRTGKQPYTGGADCIWVVQFDGGQNEPAIGDSLSTPTEAGFFLVDYLKTGGAWDGSGTGYLWLRKPGDATCGWVLDEDITNDTQVNTLAGGVGLGVSVLPAGRSVTLAHSRTLATQIGSRWGLMNIWTLSAIQLLYYIEYANADSQTQIGRGIVDLPWGTGFYGVPSGFGNVNTAIGVNGTGVGTQQIVCFDAGSVAFTVGQTVTGGTSTATGVIEEVVVRIGTWAGLNAAGYLRISSVSGTFVNNEALTDPLGGSATSDSATAAQANNAPIVYRGIENLWGNTWTFIDGYNAVDAAYRLINRDGSGTFADTLTAGNYESSLATPTTTNNYIKNIVYEDLLKYLFIGDGTAGASTTYLCDYFYAHVAAQTNILMSGGPWLDAAYAGVAYLGSSSVSTVAAKHIGGRLEMV